MIKLKQLKKITKKIESLPRTTNRQKFDQVCNEVHEYIDSKCPVGVNDDDREVLIEWWGLTVDYNRELINSSMNFNTLSESEKKKVHIQRMADVNAYIEMSKNI